MKDSDVHTHSSIRACHAVDSGDTIGKDRCNQMWVSWPADALSMAKIALELTEHDWRQTGLGEMRLETELASKIGGIKPPTAQSSGITFAEDHTNNNTRYGESTEDGGKSKLETIIDRTVAILLIRIIALVSCRLGNGRHNVKKRKGKVYSDYSTTTICKTALQLSLDGLNLEGSSDEGCERNTTFPSQITPAVIKQLRHYVTAICLRYPPTKQVPYHNVEHAYHVFISANKLLDLLLCEEDHNIPTTSVRKATNAETSSTPRNANNCHSHRRRLTFGLKSDPLAQLAFLFSALVHDVDHRGITNRQLVLEQDDLAVLYNDQSVAEQRSLAVAFTTLNGTDYTSLREVLFDPIVMHDGFAIPAPPATTNVLGRSAKTLTEDFLKFRKLVIDLVLVTDIASPERIQIVKSKWKEAFGDVVMAEKLRKRESASLTYAAAAIVNTELAKCTNTTSKNGSNSIETAVQEAISSTNVVSGLGSQLSSDCRYSNIALHARQRRSSCSDYEQNGITVQVQQQHQSWQRPKFIPSTDFSSRNPDQELDMPRDVNCFLGDSMSSSSSSVSLSTTQSNEEDDFDTSAVSRSKMNFNDDVESSPSHSRDSMENSLIFAACNYDLASSDPNAEDGIEGGLKKSDNTNRNRDEKCRKTQKTAAYQHQMHPGEDDNDQGLAYADQSSRWSTGDLSQGGDNQNHYHATRRRMIHPSPMGIGQSMKASHEMRYMPRRLHKLGVRRALDLAGSTVTAYNDYNASSSSSFRGGASISSESREVNSFRHDADDVRRNDEDDADFELDDDVDEFKATVVLEQMMHAADVSALFQDWDNVMEWSTRLYRELNNGYLSNRGDNPSPEWYENQIKFYEFYILPLAKNLSVMGVFDEGVGEQFVQGVKSNMARWIREGSAAAQKMKKKEEDRLRGNIPVSVAARENKSE